MAVTPVQLFANNAQTALAGDITSSATTANLESGAGALFPVPGANEYFLMTFVDAVTGLVNEIVKVTAMSGDTIVTMVRAQEGTSGVAWAAGSVAAAFVTAGTLDNLVQSRDLQSQTGNYAVDSGSANAMVITLGVVPPNLAAILGTDIRIKKIASANTGAVTLAVNGLTATAVVNIAGAALSAGDLPSGATFTVIYNGTSFVWQGASTANAITAAQLQTQAGNYGVDAGSANAMAVTLSTVPANFAAITGTAIRITKSAADNTAAVTLNVNALGVKAVVDPDGNALTAGGLPASSTFTVVYDGVRFVMQGAVLNLSSSDLQSQAGNYAVDSGSANALAVTLSPVPASLAAITGTALHITKSAAANTAAATLSVNGLTAKAIVNPVGGAMTSGDLPASCTFTVVYNGTSFVLQGAVVTLTKADLQSQAGNYAVDSGTANAMVVTLAPVPANFAAITGTAIRVTKSGSANTGATTLNVNALGVKNVIDISGNAMVSGALPAGSTFTVVYNGTAFVLQGSVQASGGRIALTANTSFFVATTGNDSNSGLVVGSPWLTLQHAWDVLMNSYDLAGFVATIQVANGTYTAGLNPVSNPPGAAGADSIVFQSSTATASACILSVAGTVLQATQNAAYTAKNMTITSSGGNAMSVSNGAQITHSGLIFGAVPSGSVHMFAWNGGRIVPSAAYTITGNADQHYHVARNGVIYVHDITVTLTGTPAFATSFADVTDGGVIYAVNMTFTGSATGARYTGSTNGVIDTNGGGGTYFPGSGAGSVATGAQYV